MLTAEVGGWLSSDHAQQERGGSKKTNERMIVHVTVSVYQSVYRLTFRPIKRGTGSYSGRCCRLSLSISKFTKLCIVLHAQISSDEQYRMTRETEIEYSNALT